MTTTWEPDAPFRPLATERHRLLFEGTARRVVADVLVETHAPDTPVLRATAASLVLAGRVSTNDDEFGWAVAFGSALWVYAGCVPDQPAPAEVEIAVPPGRHRPVGHGIRHRQVGLHPGDVATVAGLRVTTPARTAADLARSLPAGEAKRALERLRTATGMRPGDAVARVDRMSSARGVIAARRLVREWAG